VIQKCRPSPPEQLQPPLRGQILILPRLWR